VHIQNWISNRKKAVQGNSSVSRARVKLSQRQKSGKDVFFSECLPGKAIIENLLHILVMLKMMLESQLNSRQLVCSE
jgi:hypothetical protein